MGHFITVILTLAIVRDLSYIQALIVGSASTVSDWLLLWRLLSVFFYLIHQWEQ